MDNQVPTDCKADEICIHQELAELAGTKAIKRACMPKEKDDITYTAGRCTKPMGKPICACDTDNCNYDCTAINCKRPTNGTSLTEECDANCKAPEGNSGNGDGAKATKATGTAATGDGSQRVVESNVYALAFWILTTLTFLLTY